MQEIILAKCGELVLKGLNRSFFEELLLKNIKNSLKRLGKFSVYSLQSTVYIEPSDETQDLDNCLEKLKKIFGIATLCKAAKCEKDILAIKETLLVYLRDILPYYKTFKVVAKRSDKRFPLNSPQLCTEIGGFILENFPFLQVDVHNPQVTVTVEIRDLNAFVRASEIKGAGGMPVGTNGKALLLLSGGIDSPVAGYMIAKRGVSVDAVHFHSYPYTSERALQKVTELANILCDYAGKINLHIVPFTKIQEEIKKNCTEELFTLVMRRIMMQISEKIAYNNNALAIVTGESIGQVASQTLSALAVTDNAVSIPVFRPLIGMDKEEIVVLSRKIGTYETSVLPYEDCCSVFAPKHPKTKPSVDEVVLDMKNLPVVSLIEEALANTERLILPPKEKKQ